MAITQPLMTAGLLPGSFIDSQSPFLANLSVTKFSEPINKHDPPTNEEDNDQNAILGNSPFKKDIPHSDILNAFLLSKLDMKIKNET